MKKIIAVLICSILLTGCRQTELPAVSDTDTVPADTAKTNAAKTDTVVENSISDNTAVTPDSNSEEETISMTIETTEDDRTEYASGFFFEPLDESIKERITGVSYQENPSVSYDDLRYVQVLHYDFNGNKCTGELICNKEIAPDLVEIFYELYKADYPIEKIKLIDDYGGDDEASMADNNSSCFNYRVIAGTDRLSLHALGMAVDINPLYNPYITYKNGSENIAPANAAAYADRNADFAGKITHDDLAYKLFTAHGFTWGGDWKTTKDYQHFQKSE